MPFAVWSLRTSGQNYSSKEGTTLPFYSVLFHVGARAAWDTTLYGNLDSDLFRSYVEVTAPFAQYRVADGSVDPSIGGNPVIRCISSDLNWKANTGECFAATTTMPDTAGTLFNLGGTHTPKTIPRSNIYPMHGFAPGDVLSGSASDTYYDQNGAHAGHIHRVENIQPTLLSLPWGELPPSISAATSTDDYIGIKSSRIQLILRDPKLGLKDQRVTTLPKNIMVFSGQDLPNTHYTREDSRRDSASGLDLPLMSMSVALNGIIGPEKLTITGSSNNAPGHTHAQTITQKRLSNKSDVAYISTLTAGGHSHEVTYESTVNLKSKTLKAWFTDTDEAPIANGVIVAYSIGATSGYSEALDGPDTLPPNWHFCDGTNGTPDLRGYYIIANIDNGSTHDVENNGAGSTLAVSTITMQAAGNHAHIGPDIGQGVIRTSTINGTTLTVGTATDIGNHSYESRLDHVHPVATVGTFALSPTQTIANIKVGSTYNYTPPSLELAFIMYNDTIV